MPQPEQVSEQAVLAAHDETFGYVHCPHRSGCLTLTGSTKPAASTARYQLPCCSSALRAAYVDDVSSTRALKSPPMRRSERPFDAHRRVISPATQVLFDDMQAEP